jgi:hypothetical protein
MQNRNRPQQFKKSEEESAVDRLEKAVKSISKKFGTTRTDKYFEPDSSGGKQPPKGKVLCTDKSRISILRLGKI